MSASRRKSRIAAFRPIPGSGSRLLQFDPAGLLETESDIAVYLSEALMDDTVQGILHSFFTACRARGIGKMARASGLGRESLYKALAPNAHPRFETILKLVRAFGLMFELKVAPKDVRRRAAAAMAAPKRRKTVRAVAQTRRKSA
ncbi:MAG: putative addiction module antidote protein [Proteobacteria bacterium]|nr:putative addiction module antidote protein [Pseudomonadota bacterium]